MTGTASGWADVLSNFGTPNRPRAYDGEALWCGPSGWVRLDVRVPPTISFLILCVKSSPFDWWWADGSVPRDAGVVVAPYPADPHSVSMVRQLYRVTPTVLFVGDLDPHSIVEYVEARRMLRASTGVNLLYGGIDDAWLVAADRWRKRRGTLARVCIALSKRETVLLAQIERAIALEPLIGPRACALLRSGYKLELEGAANPAFYRKGHGAAVVKHLRLVARRGARAKGA